MGRCGSISNTKQLVEWPPGATGEPHFIRFSPDCTKLALYTKANPGAIEILDAAKPQGPSLASLPVVDVLPTPDDFTWSADGQLIETQANGKVHLTRLSPQVVTTTVPGDYDVTGASPAFYWRFAFGAQLDWVSFEGFKDGHARRWFSALQGTTVGNAQGFPVKSGSFPFESPDHTQVAMVSDTGVVVATVDHGALGTPRLLLPLDDAQLAWSNDSAHLTVLTASGNDYLLTVVDTLTVPATSTTVSAVNGYYLLQP